MKHPSVQEVWQGSRIWFWALFLWGLLTYFSASGWTASFRINSLDGRGTLSWTNAFSNGVCSVEKSASPEGPWVPGENFFCTNKAGHGIITLPADNCFFRLRLVDISGTDQGFTNLVESYGILETVAGQGWYEADPYNFWSSSYEGGPATAANLSRPHIAIADPSGNIFIADKNSHSILKVATNGTIHTVAGTHEAGFNGEGPAQGTNLQLNFPNGLWVRKDGTVYVLDTDNARVRRLATNGIMTTLFWTGSTNGISGGRGLWVKDDESLVYYCAGTKLKKWTPSGGTKNINTDFADLGNLAMDLKGQLVVTDRGSNCVFRVNVSSGDLTPIAGNGTWSGGGDGYPALETGLAGVRGIWFIPNGGYLLATHEGSKIWYVDSAGIIHLFVDGQRFTHWGDGSWFYSPGMKVSEPRAVTMDYQGNILITENDYGYVRRIRFTRMPGP
jgi:hypothetical protein